MKYRRKPTEMDAIQWTGENLQEICEFTADDKNKIKSIIYGDHIQCENLLYWPSSGTLRMITNTGAEIINAGDYLIKETGSPRLQPDHTIWIPYSIHIVQKETFEKECEVIPE